MNPSERNRRRQSGSKKDSVAPESIPYPKRWPHFHLDYVDFLDRFEAAAQIGADACWLLTLLVKTENKLFYSRPSLEWQSNLAARLRVDRKKIARIRDRCLQHGYLAFYQDENHKRPGVYIPLIPNAAADYFGDKQQKYPGCFSSSGGILVPPVVPPVGPETAISHKGKSKSKNNPPTPQTAQPAPDRNGAVGSKDSPSKARQVADYYRDTYHPTARACYSEANLKFVRARFKDGFSVDDLKTAIDGLHLSPHHRGENDRDIKYLEFWRAIKTADDVERFMKIAADRKPKPKRSKPKEYAQWAGGIIKQHEARGLPQPTEDDLKAKYPLYVRNFKEQSNGAVNATTTG